MSSKLDQLQARSQWRQRVKCSDGWTSINLDTKLKFH